MTAFSDHDFIGRARQIDDIDLPRIGALIGVGEDPIHGVIDVETRGGGFDKLGRPKMLFEPHIFHRLLRRKYGDGGPELRRAVSEGLAYRRWGESRYPSDSYPRLSAACEIDRDLALQSASWGLGQIMGFNHVAAGYDSAAEMVTDFLDDEASHLEAMIRFIAFSGLDDELREWDEILPRRPISPDECRAFAAGYNGRGYARHNYHVKLAESLNFWRGKPDTPFRIDRAELDHGSA